MSGEVEVETITGTSDLISNVKSVLGDKTGFLLRLFDHYHPCCLQNTTIITKGVRTLADTNNIYVPYSDNNELYHVWGNIWSPYRNMLVMLTLIHLNINDGLRIFIQGPIEVSYFRNYVGKN